MLTHLPPSLQKERHSLAKEVAWAKTLSPSQRLHVVAALCRDAVSLLLINEKRDRVLEIRDPLPASTIEALIRLRKGS